MTSLTIVGLAVGLAMDATAVAVATSITLGGVTARQVFRFAFHFGLFQAGMPMLGWAAGRGLQQVIEAWDHWVAFGLLAYVGGKASVEALRNEAQDRSETQDPTRGWSLVLLSVATSIDALAVGFSLVVLGEAVWYPCLVIGLVTAFLTMVGMVFGSRLGRRVSRPMRGAGGLILLAIGLKILAEHLSS